MALAVVTGGIEECEADHGDGRGDGQGGDPPGGGASGSRALGCLLALPEEESYEAGVAQNQLEDGRDSYGPLDLPHPHLQVPV